MLLEVSCGSSPFSVKETFNKNEFSNSKTLITDIFMVPREKQYVPLIDAAIYNSVLDKNEPEYLKMQK
jgi:hypothetical protein